MGKSSEGTRQPEIRYAVELTEQAIDNLAMIESGTIRFELGRGIERLGRNPDLGERVKHISGLNMLRTTRAHYIIVYKVFRKQMRVVVIAIIPHDSQPDRIMKPFAGVWNLE